VPKVKTHKGAAKRFQLTGTGKLRRRKGNLIKRRRIISKAAKRQTSSKLSVGKGMEKAIKKLLPGSRA
jgi:large subunit ribosomal protein L35